jgi:hypothetical protein
MRLRRACLKRLVMAHVEAQILATDQRMRAAFEVAHHARLVNEVWLAINTRWMVHKILFCPIKSRILWLYRYDSLKIISARPERIKTQGVSG